ncbi:MAG: hypothetical protein KBD01_11775 [Acidobacteria bacterium]|nr:hypothetical protein [Acidobacteriota bacterium]
MGYKKCSKCNTWYDASLGGCRNASCTSADRSTIARIVSAPVDPRTKLPLQPTSAPKPAPAQARAAAPAVLRLPVLKRVAAPKPVALPEEEGALLAADVLLGLEAGYHIIYRGDSRAPRSLKGFGGFTAWVPLDREQAVAVVKRSSGQNFDVKLPKEAARIEGYFNKTKNLNLLTLGRQIKLEKAGDTIHISTDPTPECGGYAGGYIYAMRFKTLNLVDKAGKVSHGAVTSVSGINPMLVLDTDSVETANTIGLVIPGGAGVEVAFLTSIPPTYIYKYRTPGESNWHAMPPFWLSK